MGADINTVGFAACPGLPVRINKAAPGYSSIRTAYAVASDGDTIEMQEKTFSENLTLDDGISLKLEGGYNCVFSSRPGYSTLRGKITLRGPGKTVIEKLTIK